MPAKVFGRLPAITLALTALTLPIAARSAGAQTASAAASAAPLVTTRITQPIDESSLVTLKGTVHPLANARNDRGAAPDSMPLDRLNLVFKRSPAQESALKELLTGLHTPGSSSYHKWLTPEAFGQQFGPSDQDIATVQAWLQSHGFSVTRVNPGRQTMEISGNVAQLRSAFHTQIHKYSVNGQIHYANATDPQIPAALAPVVAGFASLNNFPLKSYARLKGKAEYNPATGAATPQWTQGPGSPATANNYVLSPGDYAVQYDLNPLYAAGTNGTGQTIAIVNESNINIDLVNAFRTLFSLPANPPQVIIDGNDPGIDGINNPDGPNGASIEAYLDVEWAGAVAPNATVDLVIGADTALESGLILAAEHAVYGNIAPVLSLSFGGCEIEQGSSNQFFSGLWEQAAAQGITVLVSTGDAGSAGCDDDNTQYYAVDGQAVNGLASTPWDVAVGGTDFYYSSWNQGSAAINAQIANYWNTSPSNSTPTVSILGVIPEQPWNDSQYGLNLFSFYQGIGGNTATTIAGAGGGASTCGNPTTDSNGNTVTCAPYAKPSWQVGTGVPNDSVRDLPDVSLFAADGAANASFYPECWQDGDCQPASSGSSVQITGVGGTSAAAPSFAGIMALVNQKYGRQGQADYVLYPLAKQFPAAFHDVTSGSNSVPCNITTTTVSGNAPLDCIAVSSPLTVTDPTFGSATEGQIGTGTTPEYNAGVGYDLASGLGTIDANQLVTNWGNIKFTTSNVTLTSPTAGTTITHGASVTFTGSVAGTGSGTPTGNIAIETDSTATAQQGQNLSLLFNQNQSVINLSNGSFSASTTTLPGGTYNLWAHYGGDGSNASADSSKVQITVNPEPSSIEFNLLTPASGTVQPGNYGSVPSGTTGIPYGTQLLLSAQPLPTTYYNQCATASTPPASCSTLPTQPTGTVVFQDSGTTINTAVLNAEGDAEYQAAYGVGSHSVTAKYSGDGSYGASTASAITFTVAQNSPNMYIAGATQTGQLTFQAGQPTTFYILVENSSAVTGFPAAPTGSVSVSGAPSGVASSATLAAAVDPQTGAPDGVATFTVPASTAPGTFNVTFTYGGDKNYSGVNAGGSIVITGVSGKSSAITATASASSTTPNAGVQVSGTVTGQSGVAAPTGTVDFFSSGSDLGSITLAAPSSGTSTSFTVGLNSQILWQGANSITLQYSGDTNYQPSSTVVTINNSLADFTLVPQSTILTIPSSGTVSVPINLSSTNGFSGNISLTCSGSNGVGCSFDNASPSLPSGGSATVNLSVNNNNVAAAGTNYNVIVTGTDPSGQYIHTLGLRVIASATTQPQGLTITGPSGLTIVNPGDTASGGITASAQGGITGGVTFTCAVENSPTGITCAVPNATITSATTTSTLTVTTTTSAVAGNYTASITGTLGSVTSQPPLTIPITLNPAASFAITGAPISSLAPGATTGNTSAITVTPTNFTGTVNLTCALASSPANANDPASCSVTSNVDITGNNPATATMTITTTAPTTSALDRPLNKFFAVGGGIAVAGLLFFGIPARRRSWKTMLGVIVFAMIVGFGIVGCGGSSSGGGGGGGSTTPGTTAGTYTFTVTGTDAATGKITSTSAAISVTVTGS